jgi:CheY-like chemotaxis protein
MPNRELVFLERSRPSGMAPSSVRPSRFPYLIGRGAECDLRLFDPSLSRRHCRLDWRQGRLVVEDLDSCNGTFVNGAEITAPRPLADGDSLWVGDSLFAVRLFSEDGASVPRRVLVVEDDSDAADTLAIMLRRWGHEVEVAGDGIQALESARSCPPDAVLLDLDLGDGPDGLEVAHRLRSEMGLHDTRLLAVTGQLPNDEGTPLSIGDLDAVLVKPVDAQALRRALTAAN